MLFYMGYTTIIFEKRKSIERKPFLNQPTVFPTPKRGISRRTVLIGLAGVAVAGGGIVWLASSQRPHSSFTSGQTPTPIPSIPDLYTYRGHSGSVDAVAWSPDGKRSASGSDDHTVQVWDAVNGGNVFTYRGHGTSHVHAVAWSPDGKRLASGSFGEVQVWVPG